MTAPLKPPAPTTARRTIDLLMFLRANILDSMSSVKSDIQAHQSNACAQLLQNQNGHALHLAVRAADAQKRLNHYRYLNDTLYTAIKQIEAYETSRRRRLRR